MSSPASDYVLGYTAHEYERLTLQAKLLRPYTERFFRAAGIAAGMRVLDVGSGMGDVALLDAEIVGPGGQVLGIDRDASALDNARRRTVEHGCSSWVTFQATNLDDFQTTETFDAIAGRYVLLYQPDAAATLRHLMQFLKPGGIVVFHDLDLVPANPSSPRCPLFDQVVQLIGDAFARAGSPLTFGRRLGKTFVDAGLPFPTIVGEIVVGGGAGSYVYPWVANTLLSVAPKLQALGIALPEGLTVDASLPGRIEEEAVRLGAQILAPTQFGAWVRKPL